MTFKELKEVIKEVFTLHETKDEYEEGLRQLLSMIEEEEAYRRKVNDMLGGDRH